MKSFTTRLLVITFLMTISFAASAQIYVGGSIGGSYGKAESTNAKSWTIDISPEVGYAFNENWAAGARISYGKSVSEMKTDYLDKTTTNVSLFTINPYAVYAPIKFHNFAVCAEMGASFTPKLSGANYSLYSIYVTPLLTYSVNDHIILKTGLDFAKLSVSGDTNGTFKFGVSAGGENALNIADDFSIGFVYKF